MFRQARAGSVALPLLLLATLGLAAPLRAQTRGPTLEQLVARTELERHTRTRVQVRWDAHTGCPGQVRFSPPWLLPGATTPAEALRVATARLAPLFAWVRPPTLELLGVTPEGQRRVLRAAQRHLGLPVRGAELRLVLERDERGLLLAEVRGRAERDLPPALGPQVPAAAPPPALGGGLEVVDPTPLLLTRDPAGVWVLARQALVHERGRLVRVVIDARGRVLARSQASSGAGSVTGRVFPRAPGEGAREVPLGELTVVDAASGATATTDARGRHTAGSASLPAGLVGPLERVLPHGPAYPQGRDLRLLFGPEDPRAEEVNVYFHLGQARRMFAAIEGVPGLPQALTNRTVAVVGLQDQNARSGYFQVQVQGQRYEHPLFFGFTLARTGLDASVVVHERTHSLLHALGLDSEASHAHAALHEALADYFGAVYTRRSQVGPYALGPAARDLADLRRWPDDRDEDPHLTGLIPGGAAWDARAEVGALVDRLALDAARRMSGSDGLVEWARHVLAADADATGGRNEAALRRHLVRHGLLPAEAETNLPPRVRVRHASSGNKPDGTPHTIAEQEGEFIACDAAVTTELVIRATAEDPEGRPVALGLSGLEGAGVPVFEPAREEGGTTEAVLRLRAPLVVGQHRLLVTAQDEGGEVCVRVIPVLFARGEGRSADSTVRRVRVLAPVDQLTRADLVDVLGFAAERVSELASEPQARAEVVAPRTLEAVVAGRELVLHPRPGQEGVHVLVVGLRSRPWHQATMVEVEVVVGSGPRLDALVQGLSLRLPDGRDRSAQANSEWSPLPPGEPLVVEAGGAVEVRLEAWASMPGEPPPPPGSAPTLAIESAPELTCTLLPASPVVRLEGAAVHQREQGARLEGAPPEAPGACGALWIVAPGQAPARRRVLVSARCGERVTTRTLEVLVVPGQNRPPAIEAPARVERAFGQVSFDVRVSDPDGEAVTISVAGPPGVRREDTGGERVRVTGVAAGQTLLVVATDARGARAVHPIEVVESAPLAVDPLPPLEPQEPVKGLIDALEGR